jgi:hypothetical protein
MRNRIAQLLDVVSLVKAVQQAMLALDRSSALLVFGFTFMGALVTGTLTWIVDWLPTWNFANGEDPGSALYTASSIGEAAINNAGAMVNVINGIGSITLGSFIGASIAVGITLMPTIIQFIAPRVIHPVARTAMDASIGFDFITDWPSAAHQAAGITDNPIGQFLATLGLVFVYSLLLQSIFVLFLTACVFSAIVLVSGGAQRVEVIEARR